MTATFIISNLNFEHPSNLDYVQIFNEMYNIFIRFFIWGFNVCSKEYDEEALFRSKMKHRIARWTDVVQSVDKGMLFYSGDAGHYVQWDDPELVIASIKIALQDYKLLQQRKGN